MPKNQQNTQEPEVASEPQAPESTGANFLNAPIVTLPKLDPYDRPTEGTRENPKSPVPARQSYEDIRQEARGPGSDEWRAADEARARLRELYHTLQEDARYAEEYKAEHAWREYERVRAQVEQLAGEAQARMLRAADVYERMSIPVPEKEPLGTKDTDRLLLTAHERSRVEGMLARAESRGKGPFKRPPQDILKGEYARGLAEGGPGGGATVRAVVGLARDWSLDLGAIVDEHRRDSHHGCLEDAQSARIRANMIGRTVPKPPFPHPRQLATQGAGEQRIGTYSNPNRRVVSGKGPLFKKSSRRPSWK